VRSTSSTTSTRWSKPVTVAMTAIEARVRAGSQAVLLTPLKRA
jgi:hypothetical protein